MHDSSHEQDARRRKTQGQEEQGGEETNHELRETEQKFDAESKSDEGPEMMPMEEALRRLEGNEGYQKIIEFVSEGSEKRSATESAGLRGGNPETVVDLVGGVWRAVEARRKERRPESKDETEITEGHEQHEEALSSEKERSEVMSTDEQNAMSGPEEAKTGRGRAGVVPGGDESRKLNETSRKGKGKGNGGKGTRRQRRRIWPQRIPAEREGKRGGMGPSGA